VADFTNSKAAYDTAVQTLEKAKKGARAEDIHAAKAKIKQLKASLAAGKYALKDTVLKAPFNGIVNSRFVEKYETIGTDQPIVSLLDFASVDVKTAIPEQMMLKRSVFTKISCTLEAYPGRVFPASIKELGLKTDTANQSFPLTVSLDMPSGIDIQSGMAASLTIEYPREDLQNLEFLLPSTAVFSDSNGHACVWKVDPQTFKVSKVLIKASRVKEDAVFVTAELHPGDRIVTAGARFLIPDQKVHLLNHSQGK
jgi:RND family efflux transporter MFP subunit